MFEVKRVGDNRLDIEMSGKLDAEQMGKALDTLTEQADGIENGVMLFDVVDYHLPSLGAIGVELGRFPKMIHFIRQFDRAVVLTDKDWIKTVSEFEGKLIPGLEIKGFGRDQKEEAEAWLETGRSS